jgi:hypothetical protein
MVNKTLLFPLGKIALFLYTVGKPLKIASFEFEFFPRLKSVRKNNNCKNSGKGTVGTR